MYPVEDSPKGDSCSRICCCYGLPETSPTWRVTLQENKIDVGWARWCWKNKVCFYSYCTLLNTPPKEIVARGFVAVMGYLKHLRLGASPCKRTKLMLVGLGGAGKTRYASILIVP